MKNDKFLLFSQFEKIICNNNSVPCSFNIFIRLEEKVMKKVANLFTKKNVSGAFNCLALFFVILSSQLLCMWYIHQPEFPAEADKFRKFK